MTGTYEQVLADQLRQAAQPLTFAPGGCDRLVDMICDSRFVLIGEASHGTHEFYREQAQITKRLIGEKGFTAVAVECRPIGPTHTASTAT